MNIVTAHVCNEKGTKPSSSACNPQDNLGPLSIHRSNSRRCSPVPHMEGTTFERAPVVAVSRFRNLHVVSLASAVRVVDKFPKIVALTSSLLLQHHHPQHSFATISVHSIALSFISLPNIHPHSSHLSVSGEQQDVFPGNHHARPRGVGSRLCCW